MQISHSLHSALGASNAAPVTTAQPEVPNDPGNQPVGMHSDNTTSVLRGSTDPGVLSFMHTSTLPYGGQGSTPPPQSSAPAATADENDDSDGCGVIGDAINKLIAAIKDIIDPGTVHMPTVCPEGS